MSKIIMFSTSPLSKNGLTSAPSIRILEIAKALQKKGHKVKVVEKNGLKLKTDNGVIIEPWTKKFEKTINNDFDIALVNIWCNETSFLNNIKIPIIADLSTPTMLEAEIYFSHTFNKITDHQSKHFQEDFLIPSMNLIEKSDMFICANERQKWYYYGILQSLGRIGPYNNGEDIILTIPFGINRNENKKIKKDIWKKEPKLKNKKIILWPGGFFPWFDPQTAIKAIFEISKERKDVVLVFVGSYNPLVPKSFIYKNFKLAKDLAKKINVLDKQVFFFDWLKLEEKNAMYNDIEAVLITHKKNLETDFSFRTRTIDAIGFGIPIITTKGDVLAEKINQKNIGITINPGNINDVKEAILKVIDDEELKKRVSKEQKNILKEYSWDILTEELNEVCNKLKLKEYKTKFSPYKIIEDKNLVLNELEENLEGKKQIIHEKEQRINDKRQIINGKEQIINEKEQIINEQEQRINGREQIINEKEQVINEKEQIINEQEQRINEQEQRINGQEQVINEKEQIINGKEQIINEKEQVINEKKQIINEKEQVINDKRQIINEKRQIINEKSIELSENIFTINNLKKVIEIQLIIIKQFKGSIIYPFYIITSSIGKQFKKLIKLLK